MSELTIGCLFESIEKQIRDLANKTVIEAVAIVVFFLLLSCLYRYERRPRIGLFGRYVPAPRGSGASPGLREFQFEVQNLHETPIAGPLELEFSTFLEDHARFARECELDVFAGPHLGDLRFRYDAVRRTVVTSIAHGMQPYRSLGFRVRVASPRIEVTVGSPRTESGGRARPLGYWPQPLRISDQVAMSMRRPRRSPPWSLFWVILALGASLYVALVAASSSLFIRLQDAASTWTVIVLASAYCFGMLRREMIPVALGYQEGRRLVPGASDAASGGFELLTSPSQRRRTLPGRP